MKGFKATKNMKCLDFTYEVGKTYSISSMRICSHGFHFCPEQKNVLWFYKYDDDLVLLEVESLGNEYSTGDKVVCDKMKVLRVIPREEWEFKSPKFLEDAAPLMIEETLDDKGRMIYGKDKYGSEYERAYDERGNLTYDMYNFNEEWSTYDENNNRIHFKNSDGLEVWSEYDENNHLTYTKTNGCGDDEEWLEHSKSGKLLWVKSKDYECHYTYNDNDQILTLKQHDGYEELYEYNEMGKQTYFRKTIPQKYGNSTKMAVQEKRMEYDANGNLTHSKQDVNEYEEWNEYDDKNNRVYHKNNKGKEWRITTL